MIVALKIAASAIAILAFIYAWGAVLDYLDRSID